MNLNTFIVVITGIAAVLTIGVSIWSYIDTKRRYGGTPRSADSASQDEDERD